jgi:hypothetical protein
MSSAHVVGLKPWLPPPLAGQSWWAEPIRAERLAALRIGLAAVLLVDILALYLPQAQILFGADSLGSPDIFWKNRTGHSWSILGAVEDAAWIRTAMNAWAILTGMLLVGFCSRLSALGCWVFSQSFITLNPSIHNAGDTVRTIILFYLMVSPCGAVWSLDRWLSRKRPEEGPTLIYPWAVRLLFVQMAVIYFFNGVHKFAGPQWRAGHTLHYTLGDLSIARVSSAELPLPFWLSQLMTWGVLTWELSFPLLVTMPRLRTPILWMGVFLHLGIGLSMELGMFAPYMLCLYLPLVPWELVIRRGQ